MVAPLRRGWTIGYDMEAIEAQLFVAFHTESLGLQLNGNPLSCGPLENIGRIVDRGGGPQISVEDSMTLQDLNRRAGDYVYEHVTSDVLSHDMNFGEDAPRPGERLPQFDLPATDGYRFRTVDVLGRKPLLLVMGSLTCPMTASSNPILKELHTQFGARIQFAMLHVREAHPGERREQPRSLEEKMQHARDLKNRDDLPWPVIVDDPDGSVHRAFDQKPNAAYLTDGSGTIVFRALWAGDETGLRRALRHVARGERPPVPESRNRLAPMGRGIGMMREMTLQSGPRAQSDLWRAAPPIAVMA